MGSGLTVHGLGAFDHQQRGPATKVGEKDKELFDFVE